MARVLTAGSSGARAPDDFDLLIAWRADQLLVEGSWEGPAVWTLAEDVSIDYRDAITLREAGCTPEVALEILG